MFTEGIARRLDRMRSRWCVEPGSREMTNVKGFDFLYAGNSTV